MASPTQNASPEVKTSVPGTRVPQRVILIQADDLGYDDLGTSGNALVETPHLDALATGSVNVADFVVNPVCAPSRATLLTGRHFLRTGVSHVHGGKDHLHPDETTLADVFRANGWHTAMFGKWHLGTSPGYEPWHRGFDDALMLQLYKHANARGRRNRKPQETERWADEWIFSEALETLRQHRNEALFLYLPTMTPHGPLVAPERLVDRFRAKGLSNGLATLYAMVTALDEQIGRLLAFLDAEGMAEDTLLLFTSDNGPAINDHELSDADRRLRKVSARRGWKGDIWENGVRAPLFAHWPKGLKPHVLTTPLDQVDLFPTLLDWCGIGEVETARPLDGESRTSWFAAADAGTPDVRQPIFNYCHPGWITGPRAYDPRGIQGEYNPLSSTAKDSLRLEDQTVSVRESRYKLIRNPDQPSQTGESAQRWVLVDLFNDPGETSDLSAVCPEVFERLREKLETWFDSVREEPGSFTAPVIAVAPGDSFPAKNCSAIHGALQNSVQGIYGWNQTGASAEWTLHVETPTPVSLELEWSPAPAKASRFTVSAGRASVSLSQPVKLPAGEIRLTLTCVEAPENAPEACLRSVTLVSAPRV